MGFACHFQHLQHAVSLFKSTLTIMLTSLASLGLTALSCRYKLRLQREISKGYYWLRACCCSGSEGVTSEKVDKSDSHCCCCSVHMTSECLPIVRLLYALLPQWKVERLPDSLNKTGLCIY